MPGTLILVGTPIGNLSDFSPRAIEALRSCDCIAAEDTRVSLTLLNHFGIRKPLISYFEHNKQERGAVICRKLEEGETVALVTDAGMPAISDPGEDLVALCHERGIPVTVIPGPSAAVAALAVSGLPSGRFTFEGFLSVNRRERLARLDSLKDEQRTMIFYEAPHKLVGTLDDLYAAFGERRVCLARELTKLHEEILRTTLSAAQERYHETPPRGEFVLIVEGALPAETTPASPEQAAALARLFIQEGLSASNAAKKAAAETGVKKGDIYRLLIQEE